MNDCSDCFWSMFSNTPLHVFFWMRMVFAEGPWGRTVSAVVLSPLDEKEKCVNRERCFTMPLGLCKSLQAGCSHREPTPLCFQAHGQTGNLALGPKYGQLSLSMSEFSGLALVGCHTPAKATPSPPSWTGQRKHGQDSWVKVSPNTITGKTDSHWRYWINSLLKNSQQDNEK